MLSNKRYSFSSSAGERDVAKVSSTPLHPRRGLLGAWDKLAGPGATPAENLLNLTWSLLFTAGTLAFALVRLEWNPLQLIVIALFALDLAGGVSVNASPSARRWWHRPGQDAQAHLRFVAFHLHPFVLALLFDFPLSTALLMYGYLLAATFIILSTSRDLQKPVAFILYTLALLLALYVVSVPIGLEWFAPLYYLKLLVAHLPADPHKT